MKKLIFVFILIFIASNAYAVKDWAEIYQGRVWSIHEMPDNLIPEFNPNSFRIAVEITNLEPKPAAKWKYDLQTGDFSPPDIVYLNPITSKAFYLRLTGAEREAFITSTNANAMQFAYWLSLSGDVDLTDAKIIQATNYLETIGVIGSGRAVIILTIEEG
ncbi:MAG TPA: hypothetical protein ENI07_10010 [Desulfobacterales bacterium]|nr:hypothetical protein [Desulfobacterales bacterium]